MKFVIGTVVIQNDKILLVQEAKEKCHGQWNIPAGHLDENEHIFAAAIREAREETGYDIQLKNLVGIFSTNDGRSRFIIFTGEVISGEIKFDPSEILDVKWIPPGEAANYKWRPPKDLVDTVLSKISTNNLHPLNTIKELQ